MLKRFTAIILTALLAASLAACNNGQEESSLETSASQAQNITEAQTAAQAQTEAESSSASAVSAVTTSAKVTSNGAIDATDFFTKRDLAQTADLSEAEKLTLADSKDISITSAGVYVISGSAKDVTITVEAADDDKVQLVLDGATITNIDSPCIYVKNADKVFVTTTDSENSLSVTGSFTADGETNTDAVIYSKDDLVLNGVGSLEISSTDNGVTSKDDLKVTGGTITINCQSDALEAKDSIAVADGTISINAKKDGLHAEDSDDTSKGYIYICGGTFNITADSDGIQATTIIQIDGGEFTINSSEGLESTFIQINDGTINIKASDDGINASRGSGSVDVKVEINGGSLTIEMGAGDTDGIDSNGDLYINGGTISVTGQSPFDYDGTAEHNGGTMIVNGEETDTITNQFMGGGPGGQGGNRGGMPNDMQGGFPG
ncbi:MAG: carbohydrate-binding domain-containing protein [Ruminococcus sp.]|nr:carbohydrate-binding domain-containing protein [Ruminococcus sp.]